MLSIPDPRLIPQSDEPLLVFYNNNKDEIAWVIDIFTHDPNVLPWDHAMLSINEGRFVWQSMEIFNAYKEGLMDKYMVIGGQLAFVQMVNSNPAFISAFSKSVQKRLTSPWWHKIYDFLGVFGQAVKQPWIHTPGLEYCSVDVIRHLVNSCPCLPKEDQVVINSIPRETNPEELWKVVINSPGTFSVYGMWDSKTGALA